MSQFQGTWIYENTEALTETCTVTIPLNATPAISAQFGLGSTTEPVRTVTLACLPLPVIRTVDREHGLVVKGSPQLLLDDPDGVVTTACHLTWQGTVYRILTIFSSLDTSEDTLRTVSLEVAS